jgi:hypothetical protein
LSKSKAIKPWWKQGRERWSSTMKCIDKRILFFCLDCDGENGPCSTNESSEVFMLWWHGWFDLFEWCLGVCQLARTLRTMAHLRMFFFSKFVYFLIVMNFSVDIFGSVLRCDQPVQASSDLYDEGCAHVSWKETYRSGSTSLCHIWQCLFEYASW